mgnify:CR=1 FL=1|tara:strand:- start:39 stop:221 length:183 start_codon:yes stop_codon:yes gene_type:complete
MECLNKYYLENRINRIEYQKLYYQRNKEKVKYYQHLYWLRKNDFPKYYKSKETDIFSITF